MKHTIKSSAKAGFTLVELAIVLVIIGLIVGGVLVGQDLIKAAEVRASVSDLERYNGAATTFRNKFNGLPGDLLSTKASQFGMTARDGSAGTGDGNALIEGCAATTTSLGCENILFWIDLTTAEMIDSAFTFPTGGTFNDNNVTDADQAANKPNYMPSVDLRDTAYVHVVPTSGRNYYAIGNHNFSNTGVLDNTAATQGLTPLEASQIDEKVDDGLPATGIVRSITNWSATAVLPVETSATETQANGECHANDIVTGSVTYNTADPDRGNALTCDIYYRAGF